jgi:methyltransferase (TIGR00027 family)
VRQVVLLAAGLDARAFRLDWPAGTRVFELDLPDLLAVKEQVLASSGATPTCERLVAPVDLATDWLPVLTAAGFDPHEPTAWLVEGLLVYLAAADAEQVLTTLTAASAPGSTLACERGSGTAAVAAGDTASVTDLWQGGLAGPADWLGVHGWDVVTDDLGEVAAGYGRPPSQPTASGFLRARRQATGQASWGRPTGRRRSQPVR